MRPQLSIALAILAALLAGLALDPVHVAFDLAMSHHVDPHRGLLVLLALQLLITGVLMARPGNRWPLVPALALLLGIVGFVGSHPYGVRLFSPLAVTGAHWASIRDLLWTTPWAQPHPHPTEYVFVGMQGATLCGCGFLTLARSPCRGARWLAGAMGGALLMVCVYAAWFVGHNPDWNHGIDDIRPIASLIAQSLLALLALMAGIDRNPEHRRQLGLSALLAWLVLVVIEAIEGRVAMWEIVLYIAFLLIVFQLAWAWYAARLPQRETHSEVT